MLERGEARAVGARRLDIDLGQAGALRDQLVMMIFIDLVAEREGPVDEDLAVARRQIGRGDHLGDHRHERAIEGRVVHHHRGEVHAAPGAEQPLLFVGAVRFGGRRHAGCQGHGDPLTGSPSFGGVAG